MPDYFSTICAICCAPTPPERICARLYCPRCAYRQSLLESTVRALLEAA